MQTISPVLTLREKKKEKEPCTEVLTAVLSVVPTFESVACMGEPQAVWAARFWMGASYLSAIAPLCQNSDSTPRAPPKNNVKAVLRKVKYSSNLLCTNHTTTNFTVPSRCCSRCVNFAALVHETLPRTSNSVIHLVSCYVQVIQAKRDDQQVASQKWDIGTTDMNTQRHKWKNK